MAEPERIQSRFARWKDALWPLGGTLLGLIVVPIAIEQYPEFFKENTWILPVSVLIMIGCWVAPLLIHHRVKDSLRYLHSVPHIGHALIILVPLILVMLVGVGGRWAFLFHRNHLRTRLSLVAIHNDQPSEQQGKQGVIAQPAAVPEKPLATAPHGSNPETAPKQRRADSTETGFLQSNPARLVVDPQLPPSVRVDFTTNNIGRLQLLPGALTLAYVRIRPEMSAKEEDEFFSTFNLGGGPAAFVSTENNYWEPGQNAKAGTITETMHASGDDPQTLFQNEEKKFEDVKNGRLAIYFFARHGFKDKFGFLTTESCYFWEGPQFDRSQCHGHNGPAQWPKIKPK